MKFTNTGVMCMIHVKDNNCHDGIRSVDLGNYYIDENGNYCLITSAELARRYAHLVAVPVYVRRPTTGAVDVALLCDCGELFPESGECKFCGAVANPPRH